MNIGGVVHLAGFRELSWKYGFQILFLIIFFNIYFVGCLEPDNDAGGSDNGVRPYATIYGNAYVSAPIRNGKIRIYNYKTGEVISESVTDSEGKYSVEIKSQSQLIQVSVFGGSYSEPSSLRTVNLDDEDQLRSLAYYESGEDQIIMITPLTHLLSYVNENNPILSEDAIDADSKSFRLDYFGFNVLTTKPKRVDASENQLLPLDDGIRYGFVLAAYSLWTENASTINGVDPHTSITSYSYTILQANDYRADELLNGTGFTRTGEVNVLGVGSIPLNETVYRTELGRSILAIVDHRNNVLNVTKRDILSTAESIANSVHPIFNKVPPVPIDNKGPTVIPTDTTTKYYGGTFDYSVTVSDLTDVVSVEFDIDGLNKFSTQYESRPTYNIVTTNYAPGEHIIGTLAQDMLGNTTYYQQSVIFDNSGPILNMISKDISNSINYTLSGTYVDAGVGIKSIVADGVSAEIFENGTWGVDLQLSLGRNTLSVDALDMLGNSTQAKFNVVIDVEPPQFTLMLPDSARFSNLDGTNVLKSFQQSDSVNVLYRSASNVSLNGLLATPGLLTANEYPYYKFKVSDPSIVSSGGIFSYADRMVVEMKYERGNVLLRDWVKLSPINPSITPIGNDEFIIPIASEGLGDRWYLGSPSKLHVLTIRITDEASNVVEFIFSFKINVMAPKLDVTVAPLGMDVFGTTTFQNRELLDGISIDPFRYELTNPTNVDLFISVAELGTSDVVHEFEDGIRENLVNSMRYSIIQGEFYELVKLSTTSTVKTCVSIGSVTVDTSINDGYYGGLIDPLTPIMKIFDGQISKHIRVPVVIETKYHTTDTPVDPPRPIIPTWTYFFENSSPYVVDSTDFFSGVRTAYNYGYSYSTGGLGAKRGIADITPVDNVVCSNIIAPISIGYYDFTKHKSVAGYPRNVFNLNTLSSPLDTISYSVNDDTGTDIQLIDGFFKVPSNSVVTLTKTFHTPMLTHYNDLSVANQTTYSSYTKMFYDKNTVWTFNAGINIDAVVAIDYASISDQIKQSTIIPEALNTGAISR